MLSTLCQMQAPVGTPCPVDEYASALQNQILDYYHGCDENGKYCAYSGTQTHISGIPGQCATSIPHSLPDVITIPMHTCLCGSLPQRSVQTTTLEL